MTVAELAMQKIYEFAEEHEKEVLNMKLVTMKKLVPEQCEVDGDILRLKFTDGTRECLNVRDCNVTYSESGLTETMIASEDIFDHDGKYMEIYPVI